MTERSSYREIPVYKGKSSFGYALSFLKSNFNFCKNIANEIGEIFEIKLPGQKIVILTDPIIIDHILRKNPNNYTKDYRDLKTFLGKGLLASEGKVWKKQRRIIQPVFKKEHLEKSFNTMIAEMEGYCKELQAKIDDGQEIEMAEEMMKITGSIATKTLFSTASLEDVNNMHERSIFMLQHIVNLIFKPYNKPVYFLLGRNYRFKKNLDAMHDMIYRLIRERQNAEIKTHDLLSMLLESKDSKSGVGMDIEQIKDEIATLYVAGHDTSANALFWTFYLLVNNPDKYVKLINEIQVVLKGKTPKLSDLKNLVYTECVLNEAMRLYPPAYAITRKATEIDHANNYEIPTNKMLYISILGLHRSKKYWSNPHDFIPERFSNIENNSKLNSYYMPFGNGARKCIGNHFAIMEMKIILSIFIQRFNLLRIIGDNVVPQSAITLKSTSGMKIKMENRNIKQVEKYALTS